eukprot:750532-Pleurochrysis_carterae.AAC.1
MGKDRTILKGNLFDHGSARADLGVRHRPSRVHLLLCATVLTQVLTALKHMFEPMLTAGFDFFEPRCTAAEMEQTENTYAAEISA